VNKEHSSVDDEMDISIASNDLLKLNSETLNVYEQKKSRSKLSRKFAATSSGASRNLSKKESVSKVKTGNLMTPSKYDSHDLSRLKLKMVNDLSLEAIVDIHDKLVCEQCNKQLKTRKTLTSHRKICQIKQTARTILLAAHENTEELNVTVAAVSTAMSDTNAIQNDEDTKKNVTMSKQKLSDTFGRNEPLVVQVVEMSKKLNIIPVAEENLSDDFPSLFSAPNLSGLVNTFIQFHQVPISQLSFQEAQFADLLVSELVTAGIDNIDDLHEVIAKIHKSDMNADIETWKKHLEQKMESMSLADKVDKNFSFESAIQIMILNSLDKLM